MRKYFGATVRLPSDWLDVAATYLILPDKNLTGKALPTCLRKSMDTKFGDFDAYQLGMFTQLFALSFFRQIQQRENNQEEVEED